MLNKLFTSIFRPKSIVQLRKFSLMVQQQAPSFHGTAVINEEFKEIRLEDYRGKYLVLFFYPLDFTFVCPTEIIAFNDSIAEFKKEDTQIVGVSTDSHFTHLAWISTPKSKGGLGSIDFPLLSDYTKSISRDYGILLEKEGFALRGLFIIDKNGIIRHISINDLPVGRSVSETIRLIRAFKHVEKHGEVCPAQWSDENRRSIKPTPKDSMEYFNKLD